MESGRPHEEGSDIWAEIGRMRRIVAGQKEDEEF